MALESDTRTAETRFKQARSICDSLGIMLEFLHYCYNGLDGLEKDVTLHLLDHKAAGHDKTVLIMTILSRV